MNMELDQEDLPTQGGQVEMDTTPSDSETTTLTDTIEISSNIDVHPIMPRDQSLSRLVKEVRSFTESLTGATQPHISSDQTHMSIDDDSAST
jgi:cell division protein FtsX